MSGLINKVKGKVQGYHDDDTGKTGIGGVSADGQKAFKNYKTDAADGKVDWKTQAKGVFTDIKGGTSAAKPPPQ